MAANPLAMPPRSFSMHLVTSDGEASLRCNGYLVGQSSEQLRTEIEGLSRQYKKVQVDLAQVRMMDSSGLGALVSSYLYAKSAGCEIKLANPSHRVKAVLATTHLASLLALEGD